MPTFRRYVGIDYSGAETSSSSRKGLRVFMADRGSGALAVHPPPSRRTHWTRREVAEWLVARLAEPVPTLVGIDHGFSFPLAYFGKHRLPHDWPAFLDDFHAHWPTDGDGVWVKDVREGRCGRGSRRTGDSHWKRVTELCTKGTKSVFLFGVNGSVAHSTHSGLPWLRFMRQRLGSRVHFWPFDGWTPPPGRSVVAEVYPSLWRKDFAKGQRTDDQHDAYVVAERLRQADEAGELSAWFAAPKEPEVKAAADIEGWILGVPTEGESSAKHRPRARSTSPRRVSAERGPAGEVDRSSGFLEGLPPDQVVIAEVLLRFHREVFMPDVERLLEEKFSLAGLRLAEHFAELHRRFDRLDALAAETRATLQRVEGRGAG